MIINNIASLVNNFILGLYAKDIKFYQIIIGLFIFDFIVYTICKMIRQMKRIKY